MAQVVKEKSKLADTLGRPQIGDAQAAIAPLVVTVTSGSEPTVTNTLTVANSATPTVVELLKYARENRSDIEAIYAILQYHGLAL